MTDAKNYGFLPTNSGEENAQALNNAIKNEKEITVSVKGIYDISDTVYLKSGTHLYFSEGVTIRRQDNINSDDGNLFINEGAFTGVYDKDISIAGLHLITNSVQSTPEESGGTKTITGLRAHIAFLYIKDVYLSDITVTDLSLKDYAIQISDFNNAVVENCHIEGLKDGIHFGPGTNFTVRNCRFRTADDAIALNCYDYSVSNPNCGDIENGLIENCIDLKGEPTASFFIRILVGGWKDWEKGMTVYHSDAVNHNGRLYRVVMRPDNEAYISLTPPVHENGFCELDGIRWLRTHKGYEEAALPHTASCRNITVKNIVFMQPRKTQILIYSAYDEYVRSYHRGYPIPEVKNIVFSNLQVMCECENIVNIITKTDAIEFHNCYLNGSKIKQEQNSQMAPYPESEIIIR